MVPKVTSVRWPSASAALAANVRAAAPIRVLIVVDFPGTPTWWYENPAGEKRATWKIHMITPVTNNESPTYLDFDGDGKRELVAAFSPERVQILPSCHSGRGVQRFLP